MEYYEEFVDGVFLSRGFLKNEKKEGTWFYFYETGELKQEIEYENGIEHGAYKFFGKDGTLLISSTQFNGLLDGEWREYYENGQLKEIGQYKKNEYYPIDFWDQEGNQLLKNGTGKKIEEYGTGALVDIYEQYYNNSKFIKEVKIQGYTYLGFPKKRKKTNPTSATSDGMCIKIVGKNVSN
jgi:antitoxin component YwqK of YwqJK toxin-antitoxin module